MSIRVGITDGNREFFERFHAAMNEQYSEEIEVYLFPTLSKALKAVDRFRVRVVLLEPEGLSSSDLPTKGLPKTAYFARLADRKQDEKDWQNRPEQDGGETSRSSAVSAAWRNGTTSSSEKRPHCPAS